MRKKKIEIKLISEFNFIKFIEECKNERIFLENIREYSEKSFFGRKYFVFQQFVIRIGYVNLGSFTWQSNRFAYRIHFSNHFSVCQFDFRESQCMLFAYVIRFCNETILARVKWHTTNEFNHLNFQNVCANNRFG